MNSNAATSNSTSKIIKFEDGVPITVILDGKRGIAGESTANQWGQEEWKHWVNGDANLIYLPAAAQKQLEMSGAQFRDWVSIEKVRGGKNSIWRVSVEEPHSDRSELGRVNYLRQREAVSPIRQVLTGRSEPEPPPPTEWPWEDEPAPAEPRAIRPALEPPAQAAPARTRKRPAAAEQPAAQPQPIAPAATQIPISAAAVLMDMSRPDAKAMASALMQSIDAFAVAQSYAHQKNLMVSFTSEDVRAFAISNYIGQQKGGR